MYQLAPFCNDVKVFETNVLNKIKLTYHGCIEPIYKTLHLVDHHICWRRIDKYIYVQFYNT